MKVLYLDKDSFCAEDFLEALSRYERRGEKTEVVRWRFENQGERENTAVEKALTDAIRKEKPAFLFSFNYYPLASTVANREKVLYVSWVYDNPQSALYSYTMINAYNRVFLFDSGMAAELQRNAIPHVYYLPLAASVQRLDELKVSAADHQKYDAEVSFVGSLYTEEHTFFDRMAGKLDPETKGYLWGLMRAQQQVYGVDLMRPALRSDVLDAMFSALPLQPRGDSVETKEYLYDDYVLSRKLTSVERTEYLAAIGEKHPISVYTKDAGFSVNGITNKGMVMYYTEMPLVFKCSKINLNISLRSIRDGIPLRCFDIMGAGGFLLTNFQSDLLRFFEPDKDFVYFESEADLLAKVDYYLAHPVEREAIARNGYNKIRDGHTFDHRVHEMMEIITAS